MTPDKITRTGSPALPLAVVHTRFRDTAGVHRREITRYDVPAALVAIVAAGGEVLAVCADVDGTLFTSTLSSLAVAEGLEHPVNQAAYRALFALEERKRGAA